MRSVFRRSRSPRRRGKTAEDLIKDVKSKEQEFYAEQISVLEAASGVPTQGGKSQGGSLSRHRSDHPSLACIFRSMSYEGEKTCEINSKNIATMEDITLPPSMMSDRNREEKVKSQHRRGRSLSRLFRPINRNNLDVSKENQTKEPDAKSIKQTNKYDRKQLKGKANIELSSLFSTLALARCALPVQHRPIPIEGENFDYEETDIQQIRASLKKLEEDLLDAKRSGEEVNRTKVMNDLLAVVATVNQTSPSDDVLMQEINSVCISAIEQTSDVSLNSSITGSDYDSVGSNDFIDHLEMFTFQQLGAIWKSFIKPASDDSSSHVDSDEKVEPLTRLQANSNSTISKVSIECGSTDTAETESLSIDLANDASTKENYILGRAAAAMSQKLITFPRDKIKNDQLCSGNNITCGYHKDGSHGCHPLSWMKLNEEEMNNLLDDLFWGANTFEQDSSRENGRTSKKSKPRKKDFSVLAESKKEKFNFDPFDEIVASRPRFKRSWTIEEQTDSVTTKSESSIARSESYESLQTKSFFQNHTRKCEENRRPPTKILLGIDDSVQKSRIKHNSPPLDFEDDVCKYGRKASKYSGNRGGHSSKMYESGREVSTYSRNEGGRPNEMHTYLDAYGY